ncbi:MAG: amylopullulanase [Selenomonas sp.]|nr:amylopullulanase [Selenomonas sp.]
MSRKQYLRRAIGISLALGFLATPVVMPVDCAFSLNSVSVAEAAAVSAADVVLVGTVQSKLGAGTDWAPADGATIMQPIGNGKYQFKGKLPKGIYEFKIAIGGSWNENYGAGGSRDGNNMSLKLKEEKEVTFTYDSLSHETTVTYEGMEMDLAAAKKAEAAEGRLIVLTGTVQMKAGAQKDWDPGDMATRMKPLGHDFYSLTVDLPAGTYYYKIAIGGSWAENYGLGGHFDGANVQLTLPKAQKVTFYYNDKTHAIADSTSYKMLDDAGLPKISGSFGQLQDNAMRDLQLAEFYQQTMDLKAGTYDVKVQQKGKKPLAQKVEVKKDGPVTFYYDSKENRLIADDGRISEKTVIHDTWSKSYRVPFEAVKTGTPVTLRLAVGKDEVSKVKAVLYKAKITASGGDEYNPDFAAGTKAEYPMNLPKSNAGQDYWEVTLRPQENGIYGYKFVLDDTKEYGDDDKPGHTGELKLRGAKPFQLTVYSADFHTPDWAKEAVVYQIFPDRFFNGDPSNDNARSTARGNQPIQHRAWKDLPANASKSPQADGDNWECNDFFGGDIAGITQKLDYLQNLGITAIYVNPLSAACSNHRYDAVDYGNIDPILGKLPELKFLAAEMQKRGMHLIMDGVFNHVGDDSIYFDRYSKYKTVGAYEYWSRIYDLMNEKHIALDAAKIEAKKQLAAEGQIFSPWHWENWFEIRNEKTRDSMGEKYAYHDWQGFDSLTPFRDADYPGSEAGTRVSDLGDYLLRGRDGQKGVIMKWFDDGLSGWRLDVAKEVPPGFWANVRKDVKSIRTKSGEEPLLLGEIWQDGSQFLTGDQFDSVMNYKLSFAVGDLFLNQGKAEACDEELTILRQNYPKEALYDLMNIVDSHDTVRAIYKFGGGKENVAQATRQDFAYRQGKARLKLAARFLMGYPCMPTIYYGDEAGVYGSADPDCRRTYPWGREDKELVEFYRQVIGVRQRHKQLFAHGDVRTLLAKGDVYAFARTNDKGKAAVIVLNRGKDTDVELPAAFVADGTMLSDQLTSQKVMVSNGHIKLHLNPNQGLMLVK